MLPFFEQYVEPPLCCAVREGLGREIVGLLLKSRADANMVDSHGQSPLALLCSASSRPRRPAIAFPEVMSLTSWGLPSLEDLRAAASKEDPAVETAACLLAAGADEELPDHRGATAAGHAAASASRRLATLVGCYRGAQACAVLARSSRRGASGGGVGQLPPELLDAICSYLVPASVQGRIRAPGRVIAGFGVVSSRSRAQPPEPDGGLQGSPSFVLVPKEDAL